MFTVNKFAIGAGVSIALISAVLFYGYIKHYNGYDACLTDIKATAADDLNNAAKGSIKHDAKAKSIKTDDLDNFGRSRGWLRDKANY